MALLHKAGFARNPRAALILIAVATTSLASAANEPAAAPLTFAETLEAAPSSAWQAIRADRLLVLALPGGTAVIELAPAFAPNHVRQLQTLAAARWFDGLAVVRSQDNYVVQWGDPDAEEATAKARPAAAKGNLAAEFDRNFAGVRFAPLPDGDVYADGVGFVDGLPVAHDRRQDRLWLAHCYGMVGAGRGDGPDSGSAAELYVVTGHAPRHLDRNVTLLGRVIDGMPVLSSLPRGTGALGFFENPSQRIPIVSLRQMTDLPAGEQRRFERIDTSSPTFAALMQARKFRRESWFEDPAGHVDLCNMPLPVRELPIPAPTTAAIDNPTEAQQGEEK